MAVPILSEDIEDPVLDWLNGYRLLGEATDEWYSVVCPWAHNTPIQTVLPVTVHSDTEIDRIYAGFIVSMDTAHT